MKTRFSKKFLACVLSVCMILTVCAGALTVSAAVAGTATIGTAEIATTDTQAVVPVTLTADAAIGGADLFITVPADADITVVDIKTAGYDLTYASGTEDVTATAGTAATATVNETDGVAQFVLLGNGEFDAVATTVEIELTFTGTFAEGTHAVAFADGTLLGTAGDETAINAALTNGAIVATVAHTHNYVAVVTPPTCTEDGYTTYTCDCNDTYTEAGEPATGHAYGKPVDNGDGTHTATCANDPAHTVTNVHSYVDGTCECDAKEPVEGPIVDDTLVFAGAAVGYSSSSLQVNFRMRNNILTKYSNMELVIIPQKYDTTTYNLIAEPAEIVVPYASLAGTGTFRTYAYTDIYLYELGLEIQYMLRGTDAEGNAVQSPLYTTSPASYLKTLFSSSTDAALRTVITDTLIVGDESSKSMALGNPDSDLAKAPSIIADFDTSEATPSVDSYNTVDTHNATNADWGVGSTGTHRMSKSVAIGKAPSVSWRIRGGSSIDLEKFSVRVTYSRVDGTGATVNYDRTFTSADTANVYKSGTFAFFKFDEIGLVAGNADLNIVATYDGAEVFNAVYSAETYLGANMDHETIGGIATALIKLGISYRAMSA